MERSAMAAFIIAAAPVIIINQIMPATAERSDGYCGPFTDWSLGHCDPGRCCSKSYYCGKGSKYCSPEHCFFGCPPDPPPFEVIVNATHNHDLDHHHHHHRVMKAGAVVNALSSSSVKPLSCATSLSGLPMASLDEYPWAAFGAKADDDQNDTTTTTNCGRCLKVTNVGAGGFDLQEIKVRIVHELNDEGLELDSVTFNQLLGRGNAAGRLAVKYMFESC